MRETPRRRTRDSPDPLGPGAGFLIWNDLVKSACFVRTLHPVAQAGSSHRTAQIGEHAALVVAETRSRRLITSMTAVIVKCPRYALPQNTPLSQSARQSPRKSRGRAGGEDPDEPNFTRR